VKKEWQVSFACWKCGACCRALGCPFLVNGTECSVYDFRPDFCRIGYSKPEEMSVPDYLELTERACRDLEERYPLHKGE
jgi:Fe-S-cluster containining protein